MTAATLPASAATASVAARVARALRDSEFSQVEAARHIGLDKTKLSKSLSGARRFRIEELSAIAELTGVSLDWLSRGVTATAPASDAPASDALAAPQASTPAAPETRAPSPATASGPADSAPESSRPGGAKAQRMRARIAEAAWQLFSEWGYHRVRMIDIARQAGISAAGLHYHYTSKQDVFDAALQHSAQRLANERAALLQARAPDASAPAEHLALLQTLIEMKIPRGFAARITDADTATTLAGDWSIWLQNYAEIAVGAGSRSQAAGLAADWDAILTACLAAGQRVGAFELTDPAEAAAQLTIFLDGLVLRTLAGAVDSPHTLIDRYLTDTILAPGMPASDAHTAPAASARAARTKGEPAS
ncbi:TetR/AcrR family transcriptional regulator [Brevibacterium gallinarum]|uniref:TetR family transcriptional regulator n=1 Tax=Brevibacterium gallinarum TaxID=2762220 RepID=A0ABR8WS57_9MICO|nr:TetR/AcrR family transcriptional regulator [Brevibacterium gallinarum]MBD8019854.1 TetR family transcriptional regulator [Brevibacterium gallinarum]